MASTELVEGLEAMKLCVSCRKNVRQGKLLQCLHAICEGCVSEHTHGDGTRVCPRCTRSTERQVSGQLPSLPSDLFANDTNDDAQVDNLTLLYGDHAQTSNVSYCDECGDGTDTRATHRCKTCSFQLCGEHASSHPKRRAFAGHVVSEIRSFSSSTEMSYPELGSGSAAQAGLVAIKCPLHPHVIMERYCVSCEALVCEKCLATGAHSGQGHGIRRLQEAADNAVKELDEQFGRTDEWCDDLDGPVTEWSSITKLESVVSTLDEAIHEANEEHRRASAKIEAQFDALHKFLDARKQLLCNEVDRICWDQLQPLEKQQELTKQRVQECRRAARLLKYFSARQHHAAFLRLSHWLSACALESTRAAQQQPCLLPKIAFEEVAMDTLQTNVSKAGLIKDIAIRANFVKALARSCRVKMNNKTYYGLQLDVAIVDLARKHLNVAQISRLATWSVALKFANGASFQCRLARRSDDQSDPVEVSSVDPSSAETSGNVLVSHNTVDPVHALRPALDNSTFVSVFLFNTVAHGQTRVQLELNGCPVALSPEHVQVGGNRTIWGMLEASPVVSRLFQVPCQVATSAPSAEASSSGSSGGLISDAQSQSAASVSVTPPSTGFESGVPETSAAARSVNQTLGQSATSNQPARPVLFDPGSLADGFRSSAQSQTGASVSLPLTTASSGNQTQGQAAPSSQGGGLFSQGSLSGGLRLGGLRQTDASVSLPPTTASSGNQTPVQATLSSQPAGPFPSGPGLLSGGLRLGGQRQTDASVSLPPTTASSGNQTPVQATLSSQPAGPFPSGPGLLSGGLRLGGQSRTGASVSRAAPAGFWNHTSGQAAPSSQGGGLFGQGTLSSGLRLGSQRQTDALVSLQTAPSGLSHGVSGLRLSGELQSSQLSPPTTEFRLGSGLLPGQPEEYSPLRAAGGLGQLPQATAQRPLRTSATVPAGFPPRRPHFTADSQDIIFQSATPAVHLTPDAASAVRPGLFGAAHHP